MQHAADLTFELGVVIGADPDDDPDDDRMNIPVGVLDEAAHIIEHVATRIETSGLEPVPVQ